MKQEGAASITAREVMAQLKKGYGTGYQFTDKCEQDIAAIVARYSGGLTAGGAICKSHGLAVLVTHVNDGEPCSDYLTDEQRSTSV